MKQKGRKPKPTQLKVLNGNPGKRPLNDREPKPETTIPKCPDFLDADAKAEWARLTKELKVLGLISQLDRSQVAILCQEYSRWKQATQIINRLGTTFETEKGYIAQRPEVGVANKAIQNILKISANFGLSPSDRVRIVCDTSHDENGEEADRKKRLFG